MGGIPSKPPSSGEGKCDVKGDSMLVSPGPTLCPSTERVSLEPASTPSPSRLFCPGQTLPQCQCHAHYLCCWYGTCSWSSFRTQHPRWPERGRKDERGKRKQITGETAGQASQEGSGSQLAQAVQPGDGDCPQDATCTWGSHSTPLEPDVSLPKLESRRTFSLLSGAVTRWQEQFFPQRCVQLSCPG